MISGTTTMSYSLKPNGSNALPDWVALDSANFRLNITPPDVSESTTFSVVVETIVNGDTANTRRKIIYLEVVPKSSTEKSEVETSVVASTYVTTTLMAAGAVAGVASSAVNVSNFQSIWMIVNQFQLLLLIPLTGAYLPQKIIDYLVGMKFVMLNFSFIPLNKSSAFQRVYDIFGFEQQNEYLKEIDAKYGSTLLNILPFLLIILLLI